MSLSLIIISLLLAALASALVGWLIDAWLPERPSVTLTIVGVFFIIVLFVFIAVLNQVLIPFAVDPEPESPQIAELRATIDNLQSAEDEGEDSKAGQATDELTATSLPGLLPPTAELPAATNTPLLPATQDLMIEVTRQAEMINASREADLFDSTRQAEIISATVQAEVFDATKQAMMIAATQAAAMIEATRQAEIVVATRQAESVVATKQAESIVASRQADSASQAEEDRNTDSASKQGKIVYVCFDGNYDQICIMDGGGGNQEQLTFTNATDFYPVLSPDGGEIAFSSRRDGYFALYLMNSDGSNPHRVLDLDYGSSFSPDFSPDGRRIVFSFVERDESSIMIVNRDGSDLSILVTYPDLAVDPVWSPDGSRIIFAANHESQEGFYYHYMMNANGSNVRRVDTGITKEGGRSDWSPDGRWLSIYAGPDGRRDIYHIALDGSQQIRLTNEGDNLSPSYSPGGDWISFTSYQTGDGDVYKVRMDGEIEQLTANSAADWQPRWGGY